VKLGLKLRLRCCRLIAHLPPLGLRTVLIVPFVLQIVGAVAVVGLLAFYNGQQAVNSLANELMRQVSSRVDQHLTTYLQTPEQINRLNLDAIDSGLLQIDDLERFGRWFWQQLQIFEVSYIGYGLKTGEFVGVGVLDETDRQLEISETSARTNWVNLNYAPDARGNRAYLLYADPEYKYQSEIWYSQTLAANRPTWNPVYTWDSLSKALAISQSFPMYDQNQRPIGVMSVDLLLSNISDFLRTLEVSPGGKIFVVERDGLLIADTSAYPPFQTVQGADQRLSVFDSPDPVIQATALSLRRRFNGFQRIRQHQQFKFSVEHQRYFVDAMPWQGQQGLDWLVVVAVPEADFMEQINQNNRITAALCLVALFTSLTVGVLTARWVTQPILRLNRAARTIAMGNFGQRLQLQRRDELGELAASFNGMAEQLQTSFQTLEQTNQALEQRVADRTASLAAANAELICTLEQLRTTQAELIQSEKMAMLGQLVAGIAHEINTPLAAIQASISNITGALEESMQRLPPLIHALTPLQLEQFFQLLTIAQHSRELLSSREERQLRRQIQQTLETEGIPEAAAIADILSKMGMSLPPELQPLLHLPNRLFVLETAYQLSIVQTNSQNIRLAVERAAKTVFALKSYARHDQDRGMVQAAIPDSIDTVLTLYHSHLKQAVEVKKHYESVPAILCYPEELSQVWSNLIHNALQAMNYRGVLEIRICNQPQHIVVQITDSGCGIAPDIQNKIFQPFFTTKPIGEGSGLGLDIVQRIVARHQGRVEFTSQPGHTTFSVCLPKQA